MGGDNKYGDDKSEGRTLGVKPYCARTLQVKAAPRKLSKKKEDTQKKKGGGEKREFPWGIKDLKMGLIFNVVENQPNHRKTRVGMSGN